LQTKTSYLTQNYNTSLVCVVPFSNVESLKMEGFDSFWWRKLLRSYENAQHAVMCPRWGAVQLKSAMPTKRIDIKLADIKPTFTPYWMLLRKSSTNGHACVYTLRFSSAYSKRTTRL